jgi:hypothetical protein
MKQPQENMQEWITILDLREQRLNHQEGTASRQQNPIVGRIRMYGRSSIKRTDALKRRL